jgi:hypothetical protein
MGSFSKITEVAPIFWAAIFSGKNYALILTKMDGAIFGRFFQKLIWSP